MAPMSRLQALFELSTALSSTLELEEVLSQFSARAAELTGASSAELSLLHQDGETIVMLTDWSGNWNVDFTYDEAYSEAGETYGIDWYVTTRRVLETQQPEQVRVGDPGAEAKLTESIARYGIASSLMLPLVSRGETLGLMEVIDVRERVFEPFDVEFCMALCNVVSPAIRNALLYREMRAMALRDELTELSNRRAFSEHLAGLAGGSGHVALLLMDLDGLKRINDTGGHLAGDAALCMAADAIRAAIRTGDAAFRLGGDEFAVLLHDSTAEDAVAVARRIQEVLDAVSGGTVTLSGGVSFGHGRDRRLEELYRLADGAAYRAKAVGGGRTELALAA